MLPRLEWRWSARIALVIFVTADLVGILVAIRAGAAVRAIHEDRAAAIARGIEHRCHRAIVELEVTAIRACLGSLWEEPDVARVAVESEDGGLLVEHRFGGAKDGARTVRYAAVDEAGTVRAFVVVQVADEVMARATRTARAEGLVAAAAFTLLGVLMALVATRRVVRPLRALVRAETAIANGDLGARVPLSDAAELRDLALAFNTMVTAVQQRDERLIARGDELARTLEEVRSLQRSKESLTAMIVHDLRSPVAAALSVIDVVDGEALSAEDRAMMQAARGRLESALALAGDLLDVSRLEAGALPIERQPFDAADLCQKLARAPWLAPDGQRIPVELAIPEATLPIVGDRRLLERTLQNLLSNAARHAGTDPVRLGAVRSSGVVRITVEDSGPGVALADRARIFLPFERGAAASGPGAGIGLALCAMVAGAHGGRIHVEAARPEDEARPGARFVLELPG